MGLARRISEFPWTALDRAEPRVESTLRNARRWLEQGVDPSVYARTLTELLETEVALYVRSIDSRAPAPGLVRLGVALDSGHGACVIGLEPALAVALLSKLLRRPVAIIHPEAPLDATLLGALSALLVESARRTRPERPFRPAPAALSAEEAVVHWTAIVDGRPYVAALWLSPEWRAREESAESLLRRAAGLELALPVVAAVNVAQLRDLQSLTVGAGWFPGSGWTIDPALQGRAILVAGRSERGLVVELGPAGRIVLREATAAPLAVPDDMANNNDSPAPATPIDAVLDAPVVVRVELGSVSMKGREWAALRPGDVLETGRRIAEPVVLRAGGQVLARGELVNVEGELGVRITHILNEGEA